MSKHLLQLQGSVALEGAIGIQPRKIAVLRALQLGDLLLAVPALRAIRAEFPIAEITLIGLPWAAAFVQRFACYIDRFVEFVGYPGIAEVPVNLERTQRFLEQQQEYGYDLVVQMHGSGSVSDQLAVALGGYVTVGYYEQQPPAGLTLGLPYPNEMPEVMRNLALAQLSGCRQLDPTLAFPLFREDRQEPAQLLFRLPRANRPWIGIHAGARPPVRRWPAEYFAQVANYCVQHFDAQIIVTGGADERSTVQELVTRMSIQPLDVVGQTSLGGLAALISELDLFISNDTGPAHIANAVQTPSVTIFGPVDAQRWAALEQTVHPLVRHPVACSPCTYWQCPIDHRCLRWVRPEMVIEKAESLLQLAQMRGTSTCSV